ncbi:MAG: hypothetical protein KGH53_02420 [Candidatus Micrarchaeota archaeon]|nr:hypothetical protein [Candidatus Micrarchaeota archaeon]
MMTNQPGTANLMKIAPSTLSTTVRQIERLRRDGKDTEAVNLILRTTEKLSKEHGSTFKAALIILEHLPRS